MGHYNNASIDTRTCGEADEDHRRDTGMSLPAAHAVIDTSPVVAPTTPDSSDAGRQEADPRLILCAEDGQYWCWYDRQFVGTHPNYHAADLALDDHERGLFEQGLIDAPPRAYTYARPADYACPCLTDPALPVEAAGLDALVGAATPQPFIRTERHDLRFPEDRFNRDAWTGRDCGHVFWVERCYAPLACPRCDTLAAISPVVEPAACPCCGDPHNLAHCREFAAEWRRQDAAERPSVPGPIRRLYASLAALPIAPKQDSDKAERERLLYQASRLSTALWEAQQVALFHDLPERQRGIYDGPAWKLYLRLSHARQRAAARWERRLEAGQAI